MQVDGCLFRKSFWPIVLKKSSRLATHTLSGDNAFFARCYAKYEP